MREIAREWGAMISDQAMQINVLQRVIAKKEDPSTHVKFIDVLESVGQGNPALASNRLLDLFWARLQTSMQDVAAEKLKIQPVASSRIYPYLRKVAVEAVNTLKVSTVTLSLYHLQLAHCRVMHTTDCTVLGSVWCGVFTGEILGVVDNGFVVVNTAPWIHLICSS
jgi:hypothetical protein